MTAAFIEQIIQAAGLSRDKLVIVPGNHDVDTDEAATFVDSGLRSELSSVEKINEFIDAALKKESIATKSALARMGRYEAYYASLALGPAISNNPFFKTKLLDISGLKIGIAELNSAWRATGQSGGRLQGGDKGYLIIGERSVDLAIEDLAAAELKICVAHHPPEWLLEADAISVENRLFSSFDLICFGHTHRALPNYRVTPLGNAVISQSGTVYATRKYFNGYQIIRWNETEREVTFVCKMYLDDARRKFVPANNVGPNGIFKIKLVPRSDRESVSDTELFLRQGRAIIRRAANEHISFTRAKNSAQLEEITEAFVCQPLLLHLETAQIIAGETEVQRLARATDPDAVLRQPEDVLLLGDGETGRTSLIQYLAVRSSEGVCDQLRIPAVVSLPLAVKSGGYERALKAYFSEAEITPAVLNSAIKKLPWIVFLDDFDAFKESHLSQLKEIRTRFPSHRLVIVVRPNTIKPVEGILGNRLLKIDIGYLSRRNIRQLARVRYSGELESGLDDPAYNLVMRHIIDARLPRTGYIVTLLLWAAEQNKLSENLNEAVLLENLISFLLGKTHFDAALRNQFDPRAQEFLLRAIASQLKASGGWLESNRLLEFIIQYFESRGLGFGAKEVLAEFISCGVLYEQDGFIAFRYPCYQEYFVAIDLLHDPKKLRGILESDDEIVLSYGRELDLWSSLARELHGVDEVLIKILRDAELDVTRSSCDLSDLKFVGREISFRPNRVRELLESPPTKDQIDEILDKAEQAGKPVSTTRSPEHTRGNSEEDNLSDTEFANYATQRSTLTLFTRIVRNVDHEKIEVKRDLTALLLRLWSAHTYALLTAFSTMLKNREADIVEHTELTPQDLDQLRNVLAFLLSFSDASRIASLLTSESLREPLREIAIAEDVPEGVRFLAGMAFAETWDEQGIELAKKLIHSMKNEVLKRAALAKMLSDYGLQRYRKSSADKFRELIADIQIAAGSSKSEKGAKIAALQRAEQQDN